MTTVSLIELARTRPVNFGLANAEKSHVKFQLFSNKSYEGIYLTEQDIEHVKIETNLPTKVFIHGWNSNLKSNWYNAFRDEYFKKGEYNIIYVDWFEAGSREYPVSAANVKPVGHFIADFIMATKIKLKNIHVIGKSLGAHVASYVGKRIQERRGDKLSRITGLDPAAPKFEIDEVSENIRLNKSDAEFVDIIHTDVGYYGFKMPLGTVDFYPNGGGTQPGCGSDEIGHNDSHGRSNWYFLESINSTDIIAMKSNSWEDCLQGKFNKEEKIIFGENVPTSASGNYYFKTNSTRPYTLNH